MLIKVGLGLLFKNANKYFTLKEINNGIPIKYFRAFVKAILITVTTEKKISPRLLKATQVTI